MKPAPFTYHSPTSLDECVVLLKQFGDEAAIIAGGQSLIPLMRFRLAQPANLISIRGIGGSLSSISIRDGELVIGASVTFAAAQRSAELARACPGLPKAINLIATPAIRSRGTVCGNLCQADPASELPAMALLLEARLCLRSASGERRVEAKDFFLGPYTTARRGDEILTEVAFPVRPADERFAIQEVTRQRGGFPLAGVAVALTPGGGSTSLRSASVACFGVHSTPLRVRAAEAALRTYGCTQSGIAAAADALAAAIEPHSDPFASADYRRSAACTLLRRAIEQALHTQGASQ